MNIIIAINEAYIEPAKTMLFSLGYHHQESFTVYLLYSRISEEKLHELSAWLHTQCHAELVPIYISSEIFAYAPKEKWWTEETYYRLLAFKLLPGSVHRALWLDADIVVNGNLDDFYNLEFHDDYAVVCKGCNQTLKTNLGLPEKHIYFNAGVILFNLEAMRSEFSVEDVFSVIEKHENQLKALDQDILNIMFCNKVIYANEKIYNHETFGFHVIPQEEMKVLRNDAKIIHFTGPIKPWNPKGANWADGLWWKYERARGCWVGYIRYRILNAPIKLYHIGREVYYMVLAQVKKVYGKLRRKQK